MKVRILIEQRAHRGLNRPYLGSGQIVDIDNEWATELLNRGDAELTEMAPPAKRSEKRPAPPTREQR